MKKYFMFALATVAMLSVTSCMNEKDMDLAPNQGKVENEGYGYISLNATTQNAVITRATTTDENGNTTITGEDTYSWYVWISTEGNSTAYGSSTQYAPVGDATSGLAVTPFAPVTYSVQVKSHAKESDAYTANPPYGEAYYESQTPGSVTVESGTSKQAAVNCGGAKNAKFRVETNGFNGTGLTVTITQGSRTITYSGENLGTVNNSLKYSIPSFFPASTNSTTSTINYKIEYTINGIDKTGDKAVTGTLNLGVANTLNTLTISSDSNGRISLSITYTDFTTTGATSETIEINSATGNQNL